MKRLRSRIGLSFVILLFLFVSAAIASDLVTPGSASAPAAEKACAGFDRLAWLKSGQAKTVMQEIIYSEKFALGLLDEPRSYCMVINSQTGFTAAHTVAVMYKSGAIKALADPRIFGVRIPKNLGGDNSGATVAHLAVQYEKDAALKAIDSLEISSLAIPADSGTASAGITVAHVAVGYHESAALAALQKPEVSSLMVPVGADTVNAGLTVAHFAVMRHKTAARIALEHREIYALVVPPNTPTINAGLTVAHFAVQHHKEAALVALDDPAAFSLAVPKDVPTINAGITVAHFAAERYEAAALKALEKREIYTLTIKTEPVTDDVNRVFSARVNRDRFFLLLNTKSSLSSRDHVLVRSILDGLTVAHFAVRFKAAGLKALESLEICSLAVPDDKAHFLAGATVAHFAVIGDYEVAWKALDRKEIYSLEISRGSSVDAGASVAHYACTTYRGVAEKALRSPDSFCGLKDSQGVSVCDVAKKTLGGN